jgi:hypothetical protein
MIVNYDSCGVGAAVPVEPRGHKTVEIPHGARTKRETDFLSWERITLCHEALRNNSDFVAQNPLLDESERKHNVEVIRLALRIALQRKGRLKGGRSLKERRGPESNRCAESSSHLHNHSATSSHSPRPQGRGDSRVNDSLDRYHHQGIDTPPLRQHHILWIEISCPN